MSKKGKKQVRVLSYISVIVLSLILGRAFLRGQSSEEENTQDTRIEPRIISESTTELISKRNEWQREYKIEKEIEYFDADINETVRETVCSNLVEVGSGLNYLDGNEWKPSNPHFVQTPTGFELVECAYKVRFGARLTDTMQYDIGGVSIPMRLEYIVISDGTSQRTLPPSAAIFGTIDSNDSSVLHFSDGFNGIDITYRAYIRWIPSGC